MRNLNANKQSGFTLIELVVVVTIFGIIATMIILEFNSLNKEIDAARCIANQYKIENTALKLYSKRAVLGAPSFPAGLMEIKSEFKDNKLPECPTGGTYTYNASYGSVTCSHSNHFRGEK